jgi:flagellin
MRINQNITAFNAYRNLTQTQGAQAKSLEKLSSGFRINRAADDAAGLVNSENLRAQIGGLKVATRNAQDAISLVQTAEGAQTEVHSILQRMRDLTVQSGNLGTNDEASLKANNDELTQLKTELTRIAEQTQFGTKKILDGEVTTAATSGTSEFGWTAGTDTETRTFTINVDGADQTVDVLDNDTADAVVTKLNAGLTGATAVNNAGTITITSASTGSSSTVGTTLSAGNLTGDATITAPTEAAGDNAVISAKSFTFQVGANDTQNVSVAVNAVRASDLGTGVTGLNGAWTSVNDISLATATTESVDDALKILDQAISDVSSNRAELGAFQNRMESTIRNVGVAVENLSAAESRIRDTDMAEEMVSFTRSQILSQAGTAMLAQANQVPQNVLSLLR